MDKTYLLRKQAADYLRKRGYPISHNTMSKMAAKSNAGGGPPFFKSARRTLYLISDLDAWLARRLTRVQ